MQQTETYNLNLIEMSDTFSTAPLNENAQKTEAAILAETAARDAETQARAAADAALDQRVSVLEGHKVRMAVGTYIGDGTAGRIIETPFTPKLLILDRSSGSTLFILETPYVDGNGIEALQFVEGGFCVNYERLSGPLGQSTNVNTKDNKYRFIAFT